MGENDETETTTKQTGDAVVKPVVKDSPDISKAKNIVEQVKEERVALEKVRDEIRTENDRKEEMNDRT